MFEEKNILAYCDMKARHKLNEVEIKKFLELRQYYNFLVSFLIKNYEDFTEEDYLGHLESKDYLIRYQEIIFKLEKFYKLKLHYESDLISAREFFKCCSRDGALETFKRVAADMTLNKKINILFPKHYLNADTINSLQILEEDGCLIRDTLSFTIPRKLALLDSFIILISIKNDLIHIPEMYDDYAIYSELVKYSSDPLLYVSRKNPLPMPKLKYLTPVSNRDKDDDSEDEYLWQKIADAEYLESVKKEQAARKLSEEEAHTETKEEKSCEDIDERKCVIMKADIRYKNPILNDKILTNHLIKNSPANFSLIISSEDLSNVIFEYYQENGITGLFGAIELILDS